MRLGLPGRWFAAASGSGDASAMLPQDLQTIEERWSGGAGASDTQREGSSRATAGGGGWGGMLHATPGGVPGSLLPSSARRTTRPTTSKAGGLSASSDCKSCITKTPSRSTSSANTAHSMKARDGRSPAGTAALYSEPMQSSDSGAAQGARRRGSKLALRWGGGRVGGLTLV